jgi:tRNA-uridine 2-sulfurtransferase
MNACLDCRIHLFSRAKEFMGEIGAAFVATGEVLGERPMSQRRDAMRIIEREAGLDGMVVRPLSAQHFEPTQVEQDGLVARDRFLAIQGRSRKPQIQLAEDFGIKDYPCPAGGCLLTDKIFAMKFRELLEHQPDFGLKEARLLKYGRHFRLPGGAKIIVGRDVKENLILENQRGEEDIVMMARDVPGPTALAPGNIAPQDQKTAMRILAAYVKSSELNLWIRITKGVVVEEYCLTGINQPVDFESLRIGACDAANGE